ncbi:MAG: hypothetical protein ABJT31_11335 [Hyphomicrobiales bacterium]
MASFDSKQYSVVLHYIGASKEQSHLVTVTGGAGDAAQMYFSSTGDGAVQIDSPTLAKGFFPLDQFEGFLKSIELLMANGGAQVIIDENPAGIRISSQGTIS